MEEFHKQREALLTKLFSSENPSALLCLWHLPHLDLADLKQGFSCLSI